MKLMSKKQLVLATELNEDDVKVLKSEGCYEYRRSYFYRMGMSQESVANSLVEKLAKRGFKVTVVSTADKWQVWPKDSYFSVKFTMEKIAD